MLPMCAETTIVPRPSARSRSCSSRNESWTSVAVRISRSGSSAGRLGRRISSTMNWA
jgi:hypothetical protein